ncbi:MAG: 1,4-dihydroxy-2-naphthoate polyprenyltransferase [Bdellovibrionales bacterium]|nr:1,4-dihydroxy-2-naphthoate polyprenyltransferase [Bdellovibrionales bacterium]NQZ19971.1 1,4-dihydroxy-2-naphthoate polyprenyltransferase [Bdellovibrionales bacterium]
MSKIYPWLLAFRFKTLTAAVVPVLVATCLAIATEHFYSWNITIYALLGAFCIQIATNLLNDAIDFKKGADTEERLGPQRVTQSGLLSEKQVWAMGLFFLVLACVFGLPLVMRGGVGIISLGLVSLFLAYGYTGGPFPLAYLGLGDLFVILFFGLFAVGGTFYLHSLLLTNVMLMAGLQIGFLSTTLIAINNLRDSETDVDVNKRTLAVRFGDQFVRFEIAALFVGVYAISFYYLENIEKPMTALSFLAIPLAAYIVYFVFVQKDKKKLNKALGLAALHQMLFGILLSVGLIL